MEAGRMGGGLVFMMLVSINGVVGLQKCKH
jgi:hypothetical protein